MTPTIIPDFVADNHPIRSHLHMAARYCTIHETANPNKGADDIMHGQYVKSPAAVDRTVLWHFTVDCDSIRQHLPVNEAGWHAGDGYDGPGNRQSIGIEACVNADGDFEATKRNVAMLVAYLYQTVPSLLPFPAAIVQHNHWSGKDCPHIIRATGTWEPLLALIKAELAPPKPSPSLKLPNGTILPATLPADTLLGPVRAIAEALGFAVQWDQEAQQATIARPNVAGTPIPVYVNGGDGKTRGRTLQGTLRDGKTYVTIAGIELPLRPVAITLGCAVEYVPKESGGPAVLVSSLPNIGAPAK